MKTDTVILKATGTAEQLNQIVDFLPLEMIDSITGKIQNSENKSKMHRYIRLNADVLAEMIEGHKEDSKQFTEGGVR